jgi:hypothetical protein
MVTKILEVIGPNGAFRDALIPAKEETAYALGNTGTLEVVMRVSLYSMAMVGALMIGGFPGNATEYGLPSDVAQTARTRCAKANETLTAQDKCMQNEARAYNRLYGLDQAEVVRYSVADEERKARIRNESGYRDPPGTRQLQ